MCGRFVQSHTVEDIVDEFEVDEILLDETLDPSFNVAPSQRAPVLYVENKTTLQLMSWGMSSPFNPSAPLMINARAETVDVKPSFRDLFRSNRCIIPATGFYEWTREGKTRKQAHYIYPRIPGILAFAGLWEKKSASSHPHFIILTTQANQTLSAIHHRMPVMLNRETRSVWLDATSTPEHLKRGLQPAPENHLTHHAVSGRVNSPTCNERSLLEPVPEQTDLFHSPAN